MIGVEIGDRERERTRSSEQSELKLFDGDILLLFDDKNQDLFM